MKIEKFRFDGSGYMPLLEFGGWRIAIANFCERLLKENLCRIERHLETDEAFILLEGEATLHIGEKMDEYPMEKGCIYNVKCGEWHCISMVDAAKVAIVENSGTGEKNTEYKYFKEADKNV